MKLLSIPLLTFMLILPTLATSQVSIKAETIAVNKASLHCLNEADNGKGYIEEEKYVMRELRILINNQKDYEAEIRNLKATKPKSKKIIELEKLYQLIEKPISCYQEFYTASLKVRIKKLLEECQTYDLFDNKNAESKIKKILSNLSDVQLECRVEIASLMETNNTSKRIPILQKLIMEVQTPRTCFEHLLSSAKNVNDSNKNLSKKTDSQNSNTPNTGVEK